MIQRTPSDSWNADQEVEVQHRVDQVAMPDGQVAAQAIGETAWIDRGEARRSRSAWLASLVGLLCGMVEIVLGLRFLLRMLGANPDSSFTRLITGLSRPLVAPFRNIFTDPTLDGGMVLEVSTLVAMIVYLLLAWLVVRVVSLLIDRPTTGVMVARSRDAMHGDGVGLRR